LENRGQYISIDVAAGHYSHDRAVPFIDALHRCGDGGSSGAFSDHVSSFGQDPNGFADGFD
jgi:hypothetical protein